MKKGAVTHSQENTLLPWRRKKTNYITTNVSSAEFGVALTKK